MKLFYVEALVEKTPYMGETTTFEYRNAVWANSEFHAEDKVNDHFEAKCEAYGDSYYVKNCEVKEGL